MLKSMRYTSLPRILVFVLGLGWWGTAASDEPTDDASVCAAMQGQVVGPGRVVAATYNHPPYTTDYAWDPGRVTVTAPFCRLEAIAEPSPRSHVVIEIWLPAAHDWNGRLLGVGSGGVQGSINNVLLGLGVNRGFATVATDNGHRSPGGRDGSQWALREPERITDFGYRAHHLATLAAKASIREAYGRQQSHSYYYGCSQGGQKAMAEAQRFPEDYDGIVAGAPVYAWTREAMYQAWSVRALTRTPASSLDVPKLEMLYGAVMKQCAGINGLVMDPRSCGFDASSLQCSAAGSRQCLTPPEVAAVQEIHRGLVVNGRRLVPGYAYGSERDWDQFFALVSPDGSTGGGSFLGILRNMIFDDPTWTLDRIDFDRDVALAREKAGAIIDSDSPSLEAFSRRGGKLLVYHGWADQQVPAEWSIEYRNAVAAQTPNVDEFFRLFMVPGMKHCFLPPPGPNLVMQERNSVDPATTPELDALAAIQVWVEQGRAPERFDVRIEDARRGLDSRTVRACRAPERSRYRGRGDPTDAASWECVR